MVEFFLAIFLMLASAWLLGEALHRIGQPALVGQLLAGVLIGPSLLNIVQPTADLSAVEDVALFFIMLLAGLAVKPAKIIAAGKRGAIVSSIAFAIPFVAGFEVARGFGIGLVSSLTVGLTISITAVPVNAIILMELGLLDSELGATVIAAGVIDDIISFVALSMIQQFAGGESIGGYASISLAVLKVAVFLGAVLVCERLLRHNSASVQRWTEKHVPQMQVQGSFIAILLIFAVGVSLLAEWAGIQLVIGAFFAGLLVSELAGGEMLGKARDVIRGATFGFFGPLAFAFIGTEFVLASISGMLLLVATLLAVAIAGKLLGGYLGAKLAGFSFADSVTIGFLMNSRGFVELVIAATAYQLGLIDESLFSMVVAVGIITTIISPIASRLTIRRNERRLESQSSSTP
jgi:Kef-type K+ transport system membrane component KefB